MTQPQIDTNTVGDADELCSWIGETPEGLARFVAAGVLVPDAFGLFKLQESVLAYAQFWRAIIEASEAEP